MKDASIKFETAKLAKEKGFNLSCREEYNNYLGVYAKVITNKGDRVYKGKEPVYAAPTQALLQKWLREEHNINIWSQPFVFNKELVDKTYSYFLYKSYIHKKDGCDFNTYEEALEEGLLQGLKLIK